MISATPMVIVLCAQLATGRPDCRAFATFFGGTQAECQLFGQLFGQLRVLEFMREHPKFTVIKGWRCGTPRKGVDA